MSSTAEILRKARANIEKPENWTQGHYYGVGGSMSDNYEARFIPFEANCFCMLGSIARAENSSVDRVEMNRPAQIVRDLCGGSIAEFNDEHSHAEVLALFDRAIARAESEAA